MRVNCRDCFDEMDFPYMKCEKCGWEPKGKYKQMAEKFARRYIKKNGNDPELVEKLERATDGIPAGEEWRAEKESGREMKVKCYRCGKEIIFPFLECTECGWIARREYRKRAKVLCDMYIDQHKDKEESLSIIWDEENHRLKKK